MSLPHLNSFHLFIHRGRGNQQPQSGVDGDEVESTLSNSSFTSMASGFFFGGGAVWGHITLKKICRKVIESAELNSEINRQLLVSRQKSRGLPL